MCVTIIFPQSTNQIFVAWVVIAVAVTARSVTNGIELLGTISTLMRTILTSTISRYCVWHISMPKVYIKIQIRDIFSSFTVYIKLMMIMMMIANMDTQLNFVPSHCPKILPVPFAFIYCITNFFVYTCLEKKWRGAYEPFKP